MLRRDKNKSGKQAYWLCLCDCGNIASVRSTNLLLGKSTKCRRCGDIAGSRKHIKDIKGQKFGHLLVLEKYETRKNRVYWRCLCDCGAETIAQGTELRSGHVTSCGCNKSKGEEITKKHLHQLGLDYKQEFSFCDLKIVGRLRFDFAIFSDDKLVCLIEYQGEQHFKSIERFKIFGKQQREVTDQMKRDYCAAHNIPLYEIAYNENIEQRLDEILEDLKQTHNIDLATIYDNTVPSLDEAS